MYKITKAPEQAPNRMGEMAEIMVRKKSGEREKSKETNQLQHFVQYIQKSICANKHHSKKNEEKE